MTLADDAAVLGLLQGISPDLTIFDGYVTDSDESDKTISAPLPYCVFHRTPGQDDGESLAGTSGAMLKEFRVTSVGETPEQALATGEDTRAVLNRVMVQFPSGKRFVRRTNGLENPRRDDVWTRPGNRPLFYIADVFTVLI